MTMMVTMATTRSCRLCLLVSFLTTYVSVKALINCHNPWFSLRHSSRAGVYELPSNVRPLPQPAKRTQQQQQQQPQQKQPQTHPHWFQTSGYAPYSKTEGGLYAESPNGSNQMADDDGDKSNMRVKEMATFLVLQMTLRELGRTSESADDVTEKTEKENSEEEKTAANLEEGLSEDDTVEPGQVAEAQPQTQTQLQPTPMSVEKASDEPPPGEGSTASMPPVASVSEPTGGSSPTPAIEETENRNPQIDTNEENRTDDDGLQLPEVGTGDDLPTDMNQDNRDSTSPPSDEKEKIVDKQNNSPLPTNDDVETSSSQFATDDSTAESATDRNSDEGTALDAATFDEETKVAVEVARFPDVVSKDFGRELEIVASAIPPLREEISKGKPQNNPP